MTCSWAALASQQWPKEPFSDSCKILLLHSKIVAVYKIAKVKINFLGSYARQKLVRQKALCQNMQY
jgi:hypothetical protein